MVKSLKRALIGLLSLWLAVVLTGSSALAASGDFSRLNSFSRESHMSSSSLNSAFYNRTTVQGSGRENRQTRHISTRVQGRNIHIVTPGDMEMEASKLSARKDVGLKVGGRLTARSATDWQKNSSYSFSSTSSGLVIPVYFFDIQLGRNKGQSRNDYVGTGTPVASRIAAGRDASLKVGGDVTISGAKLRARRDLNLVSDGDLKLATAEKIREESHEQRRSSGYSVGISYGGFVGGSENRTTTKGTRTASLDILNQGTLMKAGGTLQVKSRNGTFISSDLRSGDNMRIKARKDLVFRTARDVRERSRSTISGRSRGISGFYGFKYGNASISVSGGISQGRETTRTRTQTHFLNRATKLRSGKDIDLRSGQDTTLVNADVAADRTTRISAKGKVRLLAARDEERLTNTTSTTRTRSFNANIAGSISYGNGGASVDGNFQTGQLGVGISQSRSSTHITSTTRSQDRYQGTRIRSNASGLGGRSVIRSGGDLRVERTRSTGKVIQGRSKLVTGGRLDLVDLKEGPARVSHSSRSFSTKKTQIHGPDVKQFALSSVGNIVGEVTANKIGGLQAGGDLNSFTHKLLHGAAGALTQGIASGGNKDAMVAGAIGAVVGEIAAESTNSEDRAVNHRVGQIAARAVARLFGKDPNIAGAAAANAIQNNYLSGAEIRAYLKELDGCGDNKGCQQDKQAKYERISSANSAAMRRCGTNQNCLQGHLEKIRSANNMFDPTRGRARGFTKLSAFDRQASQKLRTLQEQDGSIAEALNFYRGGHNVSEHLRENAGNRKLHHGLRWGVGDPSASSSGEKNPSTYEELAGACKLDTQNCHGTVKSRVNQDLAMAALSVAPIPGAALAGQAVRHGGKILGKAAGNILNKITKNSKNAPKGNVKAPNRALDYPNLARPTNSSPRGVILGELDDLGRPTGVTATVTRDMIGTGSSANPRIRPPGFEGGANNHARGHLLANILGGSGNDSRNLVTLFHRNANSPNMRDFELQVRNAVNAGEVVRFRAVPVYNGSNSVPQGITITARGSNGLDIDVSVPNVNALQ